MTKPNGYLDCLAFWNLRSLQAFRFASTPCLIVPDANFDDWLGFRERIQSALRRPGGFSPDVVLCSVGVPGARLDAIAAQLGLTRSIEKVKVSHGSLPASERQSPFTFRRDVHPARWMVFRRVYGQVADQPVAVFREGTLLGFDSPVTFEGSGWVYLRLRSSAFDGLPRRQVIARAIDENAVWAGEAIQVKTYASSKYNLTIDVPTLRASADALIAESCPSHSLSDKGRIAHSLTAQQDPGFLLDPGVYEVIGALTTRRSQSLLRELRRAREAGHTDVDLIELATMWGGRAERRYRPASDLASVVGSHAVAAAERLAAADWIERGLELGCTECGLRSFVALQETRSASVCPACGARQPYTSGRDGPSVFYRLNALLDRASDQGVVPHLLLAAALERRSPLTELLLGVDLRWSGGDEPAEVDIFGVHDGRVVAGEVKAQPSDFTREQIERDVALSTRLAADIHILGSPGAIPPTAISQAEAIAKAQGIGLLILDESTMRPG